MPLVRISLLKGRSPEEKKTLSDEIHAALVESIKIPQTDFNHRIAEYAPGDWQLPPGKSEKFVMVEITMFPGRSKEAKRKLYKGIVRRLEALGVPTTDVLVVLTEPPLENWGVRGGAPADEVDIGFELKV
jgi:phenylpyruvate tautomerase PptA (4-oxalocrotonate tautomerase family)